MLKLSVSAIMAIAGINCCINDASATGFIQQRQVVVQEAQEMLNPLLAAAEIGDETGVRANLAFIGTQNAFGDTALHIACRANNPTLVGLLKDEARFQNRVGQTPAMAACRQGAAACLSQIIRQEDAMLQDNRGMTALGYTCQQGSEACIDLLMPFLSTSSLQLRDKDGRSAFSYICDEGLYQPLSKLFEKGFVNPTMLAGTANAEPALMSVTRSLAFKFSENMSNTMNVLIANGGTGFKNEEGKSSLMFAAEYGAADLVLRLIPYEQKLQDNDGLTALMQCSCLLGFHPVFFEYLCGEQGLQDNNGNSALHYAVLSHKPWAVNLLLSEKNLRNNQGKTPLDIARERMLKRDIYHQAYQEIFVILSQE